MRHRMARLLPVALVVSAMAGCTSEPGRGGPEPTPGSAASPNGHVVEFDGPIERSDVTALLTVGPRAGPYTTVIDISGRRFEFLLNCTGGELTVAIDGVATMPFPCALDNLRPEQYGAEFNLLREPGEVTVSVTTATPSVRWRMHIGLLPEPNGVAS